MNDDENVVKKTEKKAAQGVGKAIRKAAVPLIIPIAVILGVLIFFGVIKQTIDLEETGDNGKSPTAVRENASNTTISETGEVTLNSTYEEIWEKLMKDSGITNYLSSPEELKKLMSAELVTMLPDMRENPDKEINWKKLNEDISNNAIQGIVKLRRGVADEEVLKIYKDENRLLDEKKLGRKDIDDESNNRRVTMTYVSPKKFQELIKNYNEETNPDKRKKAKAEALRHFTIAKVNNSGKITMGEPISQEDLELAYEDAPELSYDELLEIAKEEYDMDETIFNICLGWFAGDNLEGQDDYWSYLSACSSINNFKLMGTEGMKNNYLYSSWARATEYYREEAYASRAENANEYIRKIFYLALTHLDTVPLEADGVVKENGYSVARTIVDAYYVTNATYSHILPNGSYSGYAGIWGNGENSGEALEDDNNERNSFVKSLDNFLILGDSRVEDIEEQLKKFGKNIIAIGVWGSRTENWVEVTKTGSGEVQKGFESSATKKVELPEQVAGVCIMLGTNGLDFDNMKIVLNNLHERYPTVTIYVDSIYHVNSKYQTVEYKTTNEAIDEYNDKLKSFCSNADWAEYVDISKNLHDEEGALKKEFSSDGIHITSTEGIETIAKNIREGINVNSKSTDNGDSNTKTSGITYKAKIAVVNESTGRMTKKDLNYQALIKGYTMPFDYLYILLVYGQSKDLVLDLVDVVQNSTFEVTVYDNLEIKTDTIVDTYTQYGSVKTTARVKEGKGSKKKDFYGTIGPFDSSNTNTFVTRSSKTDVALTKVDAWCVTYEQDFKFSDDGGIGGEPVDEPFDNLYWSEKTNTDIAGLLKGKKVLGAIYTNIDYARINRNRSTTTVTRNIKWTSSPSKTEGKTDTEAKEESFITLLDKHHGAKMNLLSATGLFFEAIENNSKTVDLLDFTKYMLYMLTGESYDGIKTFDFRVFGPEKLKEKRLSVPIGWAWMANQENEDLFNFVYNLDDYYKGNPNVYNFVTEDREEYKIYAEKGKKLENNRNVGFGVCFYDSSIGFMQETYFDGKVDIKDDKYKQKDATMSVKIANEVSIEIWKDCKAIIDQKAEALGVSLKETQKYALTDILYHNEDGVDEILEVYKNDGDDENKIRNAMPGKGSRKSNRIELFLNGNYVTASGKQMDLSLFKSGNSAKKILEACQVVTDHFLEKNAIYGCSNDYQVYYTDMDRMWEGNTLNCANYVGFVLWKAGIFTSEQMKEYNLNAPYSPYAKGSKGGIWYLVKDAGWSNIGNNQDDWKAGDILCTANEHHVMIYAGDGMVWDQQSCAYSPDYGGIQPGPRTYYNDFSQYTAWRSPNVGGSNSLTEAADAVAQYLIENNYQYLRTDNNLNIDYTFPIQDNPSLKYLSCSSYIQQCFVEAGYSQFEGNEKIWVMQAGAEADLRCFTSNGVKARIIDDWNDMQPGDILFGTHIPHVVMIYSVDGDNVVVKGWPSEIDGLSTRINDLKTKGYDCLIRVDEI